MKLLALSLGLLLCVTTPTLAGGTGADPVKKGTAYFDAAVIDPTLLPAPPAVNSPEWRDDMRAVKVAQRRVTPAQKALAHDEDQMRTDHLTRVVDARINASTHPATVRLIENAYATCGPVVGAAKRYWRTDRPFVVDSSIDNWLQRKPTGAYPSGHTACSRVMAEVLGQVYPAHRPTLRARAEEMAMHRIYAGVHYPHDLAGGRALAMLIMGALQANEDYQEDLAAALAEAQPQP